MKYCNNCIFYGNSRVVEGQQKMFILYKCKLVEREFDNNKACNFWLGVNKKSGNRS